MTTVDWCIVGAMLLALIAVALYCQRQVKSVADFLVAGRGAGRYMLTIGTGMVWVSAINIVAMFELYHSAGLVAMWWGMLATPFAIYLAITGFGIYRFRQSRAMTVAQFLEARYNRTVRVMAGVISWTVGMLAFGIFPAVGARFVIHFSGLPADFVLLGMAWPVFPVTMVALVGVSLVFVVIGGHLTVLVTDFLQGAFTNVVGLLIIVVLAVGVVNWSEVVESLKLANDHRSLATGSAPITEAGLELTRAAGQTPEQTEAYLRAGVALALAGNLLESVDGRRPNAIVTREMVARLAQPAKGTAEAADSESRRAEVHAVMKGLADRCEPTAYGASAALFRAVVASGVGGDDAATVTEFPRDVGALRYLASVLIEDAAEALSAVDPGAARTAEHERGVVRLRQSALALRGEAYPVEASRFLAEAGAALQGGEPPMSDLGAALAKSGEAIRNRTTSMLDPVSTSGVSDFNIWYFIIAIVGMWWAVMSNLQAQSYVASATSGHEIRMGNVLAQWRWLAMTLLFMMVVLASFVYTEHPAYTQSAGEIHASLDSLAERVGGSVSVSQVQAGTTVRQQQFVPVAMRHFLPVGVVGLFCALILAAIISTYDSFMHCWGSVFVQDVVVPFRKKAMTAREHIWWLRFGILMVAGLALTFSLVYPQTQSILMFFALVNSIWLAPSGAMIVGGLYWKRGTSAGAVSTFVVGLSFGVLGVLAMQAWPIWHDRPFPINGQWLFFCNIVLSGVVYIGVSLLSRTDVDLDRLLHRGEHTRDDDRAKHDSETTFIMKCFGITREFTRGDRLTAYVIVGWFLAMLGVFLVGTAFGLGYELSEDAWARFWYIYLALLFVVTVVTTVWFTLGGFIDLASLFRTLRAQSRDFTDDGRVSHTPQDQPSAQVIEEERV